MSFGHRVLCRLLAISDYLPSAAMQAENVGTPDPPLVYTNEPSPAGQRCLGLTTAVGILAAVLRQAGDVNPQGRCAAAVRLWMKAYPRSLAAEHALEKSKSSSVQGCSKRAARTRLVMAAACRRAISFFA
jgi:hypothetical protein